MFYIMIVTKSTGEDEIYICKASSFDESCRITGLTKDEVQHTTLSFQQLEALGQLDGGFIRKLV